VHTRHRRDRCHRGPQPHDRPRHVHPRPGGCAAQHQAALRALGHEAVAMSALAQTTGLTLAYLALTVGVLACLVRVVRGPSLAVRVLAVDLMTVSGSGLMAVSAVVFDSSVFLDIALFLIVTGFVGTAAFAQFIERRQRE